MVLRSVSTIHRSGMHSACRLVHVAAIAQEPCDQLIILQLTLHQLIVQLAQLFIGAAVVGSCFCQPLPQQSLAENKSVKFQSKIPKGCSETAQNFYCILPHPVQYSNIVAEGSPMSG